MIGSLPAWASADLLILLSDVAGLYTAPPGSDPDAKLIPVVPRVTAEIEAMAGGAASAFSARAACGTKLEAAKIATTGGTHMLIADGRVAHPVQRIREAALCTWFLTPSNPVTARKKWIAGSLEPRGTVHVDDGAVKAIFGGASLLPAGVKRVEGNFARGDCVVIRDGQGAEIGRGLVAYDAIEGGADRRAQFARDRKSPGIPAAPRSFIATIWLSAGNSWIDGMILADYAHGTELEKERFKWTRNLLMARSRSIKKGC